MGMYDDVNFEMDCPKCGEKVTGFQSKDSYCLLDKIDPDAVDNFYSSCKCGNWIELSREPLEQKKARPDAYTLDEVKAMGFEIRKGL